MLMLMCEKLCKRTTKQISLDATPSSMPPLHGQRPAGRKSMGTGLCIELWDSFDASGVSSCGIWVGQRPPLGSSCAECSVG